MTSSTKNVKLGVCKIYFDSVDLGYTQGGVDVSVTTDTHKVEVDQFGKTPINEYIEGRHLTVKCPLAETTLRNLVKIMPGATLVTDGVQASTTVTFTGNPVVGSTLQVGSLTFTCVTANPTSYLQFVRGTGTNAAVITVQNLVNSINLSTANVTASLDVTGAIMTLRYDDPGTVGNSTTVVASTTPNLNGTVASGTLTGGVNETKARVDVSTGIGNDMLTLARMLRLHPVGKADTDLSDDFVVPLAATAGALSFAYKVDAERVFNTEFMGYPDSVTGKLFSVGDPQAGT